MPAAPCAGWKGVVGVEYKVIRRFPAGEVSLPPSKSYLHRAILCGYLASREGAGESLIQNAAPSQDIDATLAGVAALGGRWRREGSSVRILPASQSAGALVDCRESGSTLRFLLPVAALSREETAFTGRGRLMDRPLDAYQEIFAAAGVSFRREEGRVLVRGPLGAGRCHLPGDVSSQFVSGLLFALPLADGDSEIVLTSPLESRAYVDMTLQVMERFGVTATPAPWGWRVPGGQRYRPADYMVEADYSQAAFFLAAAALGRKVACLGLNPDSLQGDRAFLDILREMGAKVLVRGDRVAVSAGELAAVTVDAREIPDLVPPLAALCCFCRGTSRIVNAGRLRLKESDRLHALATELGRLGAAIQEGPDSLTIQGAERLPGGRADAHGDHRIAMMAAVAAIRCDGPVELTGWECVDKSYPRFWDDFEQEARHG